MKEIILTRGQVALVDDEDFEALNKFNWYAEHVDNTWYARRSLPGSQSSDGKRIRPKIFMHRQILGLPASVLVDHRDSCGLNNQRYNLRAATNSQNQANVGKMNRECSSRFRGVSWQPERGKWLGSMCVQGRAIFLGRFDDELDAARAYDISAIKHFGDFARLNLPDGPVKGIV